MSNWTPQRVEGLLKKLAFDDPSKVHFEFLKQRYFDDNGNELDPYEISDRWNREEKEAAKMREEMERRLSVDRKLKEIEAKYARPSMIVNNYHQRQPSLLDYAIAAELLD